MKFLVISDLHGKKENVERLSNILKEVDAVLFAGDFTKFNKEDTALPCIEAISKCHENVFSVLGNCDSPDLIDVIEEKDISVEAGMVFFEGLVLCGSGGGSKFTGTTPNERTEEDLISDFSILKNSVKTNDKNQWNNLILISHNPPKDTLCDQCAPKVHVGSTLFRNFIQDIKPLLVVTGHIHEGCGIDKIGETIVINPGALHDGKYALVEIQNQDGIWHVSKSELQELN